MEATNELGSAYIDVTDTAAVNLPTPLYGSAAHSSLAGTQCNPKHARIQVEGGDIRYRLDGSEVIEPFGILAKDGEFIEWTDPLRNFQSFIKRMSVIATNGATNVRLNISWRT